MQHTFLKSIAEGYLREGLLDNYVFVFPGSRPALYFKQYLSEQNGIDSQSGNPLCITLGELMEKGAGYKKASPNYLHMALYRAYADTLKELRPKQKPEEFDRFRYWAEMLVNDFNDVDHYMANPSEIFRNVKDYKEIQSYYLTPEQEAIIRRFWGDDPYWGHLYNDPRRHTDASKDDDGKPLWTHLQNAEKRKTVERFLQLWELLLPIYTRFRQSLERKGLAYPGMAARKTAERARQGIGLGTDRETYVFIGLNRLTTAQHIVLEQLNLRGKAHFYWDYDPVLMNPLSGNKAGRFVAEYAEHFTACHPLVKIAPFDGVHQVHVYGIASNVAQAKVAAQLLDSNDMAVILPNENMLLPMVASVPARFEEINVTMGYPLRYSVTAQLFSLFTSLQLRARRNADGEVEYFRHDIQAIVSHPALREAQAQEVENLARLHKELNTFNLPYRAIENAEGIDSLKPLLRPVADLNDIDSVMEYCRNFFDILADSNLVHGIDRAAVKALTEQAEELCRLSRQFDVAVGERTFFLTLQRALFSRSMALIGSSFNALQIMGVLETRALGFEDVMMLSMTDADYPGKTFIHSFIPESIRRAYGLPTSEHMEAERAYHFYRILSHARRLTLIYDARIGGQHSGEASRFIEQLANLDFKGVTLTRHAAAFAGTASTSNALSPLPDDFEVDKRDPRVQRKLRLYLDPKQMAGYKLSASALKSYIQCPRKFYFERILEKRMQTEVKENIDALAAGNIFHEAMERIFTLLPSSKIDRNVIEELIDGGYDNLINRELHRALNIHFCRVPRMIDGQENQQAYTTPLNQEAAFYFDNFHRQVTATLRAEPQHFTFKAAEANHRFAWHIFPDKSKSLNFVMKIDRIDTVDGMVRLVDYKTGNAKTGVTDLSTLFTNHEYDGMFQLMVYSLAFLDINPDLSAQDLCPVIYKLSDIETKKCVDLLSLNKKPIKSFAQVADDARRYTQELIEEIFNEEVPFRRCEGNGNCINCDYNVLCNTPE